MKDKIKIILLTLFTAFSFSINNAIMYEQNSNILINKYTTFEITIASILLYLFYKKLSNVELSKPKNTLVIILSIIMVIGFSYYKYNSSDLLFSNLVLFIIAIIKTIGYYLILKRIIYLLDNFVQKKEFKNFKTSNYKPVNKLITLFDKNPFLFSFITIIAFWLIYIIAFYPTIVTIDSSLQIKQFFGIKTLYVNCINEIGEGIRLTSHHSVLHTIFLGGCINIGKWLANDNFGLFISCFIQILIFSSTLSYTISFLKKNNISNKIRMVVLLIYCIVPSFPFYAMASLKDTLYSAFVILFVIIIYDIIKNYSSNKIKLKYWLYIILISILIILFRNNGIVTVAGSLSVLVIQNKKNRRGILLLITVLILLNTSYTKILLPALNVGTPDTRESLTVPIQQTARYVNKYGYELSRKDKEVISKIVDFKIIKNRYNPQISDNIKNSFYSNISKSELNDYYKLWLKGLINHPLVYVEATINNSYSYLYPTDTTWYFEYIENNSVRSENKIYYHYNNLDKLRELLVSYGTNFSKIPGVGVVINIGFNTWIMFYLITSLIEIKKKKYILVFTPLLLTLLMCILSPVNNYFRYAIPYIFTIPSLIPLIINTIKNKKII